MKKKVRFGHFSTRNESTVPALGKPEYRLSRLWYQRCLCERGIQSPEYRAVWTNASPDYRESTVITQVFARHRQNPFARVSYKRVQESPQKLVRRNTPCNRTYP